MAMDDHCLMLDKSALALLAQGAVLAFETDHGRVLIAYDDDVVLMLAKALELALFQVLPVDTTQH